MGKHGPLPAPVGEQLRRGETRPSRVNYEAPTPRQRLPRMPAGLSPEAQAVWRHVLREMAEAGVLTGADRDLLASYCEAVAMHNRHLRVLLDTANGLGVLAGTRSGREVVVSPVYRVYREEREAMRLLSRDLGLSPAARAGLRLDPAASGDLDAFLPPLPRPRLVADSDD